MTSKDIVHRYFDTLFSQRDVSICDELLAPEYVDHDAPPDTPSGPAEIKRFMSQFLFDYPDLHVHIEDILAEGNKVAARIIWHGHHFDTGTRLYRRGIIILRLNDAGQLIERWSTYQDISRPSDRSNLFLPSFEGTRTPKIDYKNSWGMYFFGNATRLAHPDDQLKLPPFRTFGDTVFFCEGITDDGYLILAAGSERYRLKPEDGLHEAYRRLPAPRFRYGDRVRDIKDPSRVGTIHLILWHMKRNREYYLLLINGRESGKWYFSDELELVEDGS